jgi:hypothetical protein
MSRWIASALLLVVVTSGCIAGDGAPSTSAAASEDDELLAARERIAQLETQLAQTQGDATEDADVSPHVTAWERHPVPRKFRAAGPGFRHSDTLLFSLADHLVDLRSEGAGVSVTVRAEHEDGNVLGEIVLDGYHDDSGRGHEYQASLRRDGGAWHLESLRRRQLCWRGAVQDACV